MARRRMIDPNFWESEDIAKLTMRQRLLFIGLFSNADDHGRLRGKSTFIRSTIFPYDDISLNEIEHDLAEILSLGSIIIYEIEGNTYIQIKNWKRFQRVDKPKESLLPPPPISSNNKSEINSENESESDSGLKEKKEKEKKENGIEAVEENGETAASTDKDLLKSIQNILQDSGILTPSVVEVEEIYHWIREQKWDINMFSQAAKEMALGNIRQVSYIVKIFKRYSDSGFKTLNDVLADKANFERKKAGKSPPHPPPDDDKLRFIHWSSNVEEG